MSFLYGKESYQCLMKTHISLQVKDRNEKYHFLFSLNLEVLNLTTPIC